MESLIMLLVLFVVAILPVMIGARVVGANNTGFGAALLSVLVLVIIQAACNKLIGNTLINFLVAATVGGLAMSGILGTSFWRAIGVSVIATAIQIGVALLLFSAAVAAG